MAQQTIDKQELAMRTWARYAYCRDNGHREFVDKADRCEAYFRGDQWDEMTKAKLRAQRRPALTINKIISTLSNVLGEQIYNRSEIAFRPRSGSPDSIASTLTKLFKQISDNNQLDWKRSDVFADGCITSRGFFDVRMSFDDHLQGEVRIAVQNPKNVVIDPDADEYDPDTWNEVMTTKWLTPDDVEVLYGKEHADILRTRSASALPFGYDSIDRVRDRFGKGIAPVYGADYDEQHVTRSVRIIERQHRVLDNQLHFVSMDGDTRPVPKEFDKNRIEWFKEKFGFKTMKKMVPRIRWTVVADTLVLHDDWSPYKHFTIVPYFPYFRYGTMIGLVENLLDPQELLNKASSQELHVINTTANSGWKVRAGSLTNMSPEELEERGAETGIVIETMGDPEADIVKIQPNTVPTGLDRVAYKAEEHIKGISGVPDSAQGFDREDVAAKAIQAKRQASKTNIAKPLDALVRTDFLLARNVLDLVQEYYTEERIYTITKDRVTNDTETFTINKATEDGYIINDLTLGEYDVVISSVPQRETLEDSQFEQAVALKELGVQLPDSVLIGASRLLDKGKIIEQMQADQNTEEAQRQRAAALRQVEADAAATEAQAGQKQADTQLKLAKAAKETRQAQGEDDLASQAAVAKTSADIRRQDIDTAHKRQLDYLRLVEERRKNSVDEALRAHDMEEKRNLAQRQAEAQAEAAAQRQTTEGTKA